MVNLKQTGCVPARPTSGRGRKPSPLKIAVAPAPAAGSVRGFTSRPGASLRAARATWGALRIWGPWSVTVIGLAGGSLALFVFHQGMQLLLLLLLLLLLRHGPRRWLVTLLQLKLLLLLQQLLFLLPKDARPS